MTGQVVHDDVVGPQLVHQHLVEIGFAPFAIDWPVEHRGGDHARHAQATDQCGCLAVAMAAGHVGCSLRLIDEDEVLRIEIKLAVAAALPLPQDVVT